MHKRIIILFVIGLLCPLSFSSCTTMGTAGGSTQNSNMMLNTVQSVLNNGTQSAFTVFGDSDSFLTNALIEAAMPQKLKDINQKLQSMGLNHIVEKEKVLISEIANSTITTARPVVKKAINEMTPQEAISIVSGGQGAATQYLKNKTHDQLVSAITPVVNQQTERLGVNSLLSNALGGNNMLNSILGAVMGTNDAASSTTDMLQSAITNQLVDGMFNIVEDVERDARQNPGTVLNAILMN
ncbi:DUF4197 family protein [Galbibacter sp. EGI 63066]|uniref:DUF4197 family protein n=1 Tax=Galbibacter sp. EGI 63066 TaxID=2993559 RepID=UPI00224995D5|nr:DUF4197 family protein [Galbibacter sp. EGI 63066]MCX2679723.1 DUF4197 family protein [Galbibacter sp. EGI 63066]